MKASVPGNAHKTDLFSVKLAINQAPKLSVNYSKKIINYGAKNDYPSRLLFWFNNDAEHGAICKGKARYISGLGIKPKEPNPQAEAWLKTANPNESWYDMGKKTDLDEVLSGGEFIKVVSNALGQPIQFWHLDFAKCRMSDCLNYVRYSNDWSKFDEPVTTFPIWKNNTYGTSVFIYKQYAPTASKLSGAYAQPEYLSCTLDIDTDVRISTFGNSLVSKNFSAGHIVTVFNGEKRPDAQKAITDKIKGNHGGEEEAGDTVVIFTDVNGKSTEIAAVPTNDLDKQYEAISKRNQQKKLTGHNVSGVLFKIKTEGQLGNRAELIEAHELFINEYAKVKQEAKLRIMQMFYKARYGQDVEFVVEQVQPIGVEIPLENAAVVAALNAKDPNIITNYLIEKYGIKLPEVAPGAAQVGQVNTNLKGLSGRESQDMLRVVRQFDKGQLTRQQAILRLTSGYGLTEQEASIFLNENDEDVKMHVHFAEDKSFMALFNKYAHDINEADEVLCVKYINHNVKFAVDDEVPKEIIDNVLVAVKADPTATAESIANDLNLEKSIVERALEALAAYKFIELVGKAFIPTQKGLDYDVKSEIYTEYVYAKRPDVTGPTVLNTTRQFCRDMVQLTKKKALSYEAINRINNEFGENALDYRGGFYNDGTETTPWCRHVWSAVTKIRRK